MTKKTKCLAGTTADLFTEVIEEATKKCTLNAGKISTVLLERSRDKIISVDVNGPCLALLYKDGSCLVCGTEQEKNLCKITVLDAETLLQLVMFDHPFLGFLAGREATTSAVYKLSPEE